MNNRRIKFRFWCEAGKAFVKDYKYNGLVEELFSQDDFLLTPSQFTGMYDCKGKELYEGDIIEAVYNSFGATKKGRVEFDLGLYRVAYDDLLNMSFSNLHELQNFKIIGNVFENPDLMEKGELEKLIENAKNKGWKVLQDDPLFCGHHMQFVMMIYTPDNVKVFSKIITLSSLSCSHPMLQEPLNILRQIK